MKFSIIEFSDTTTIGNEGPRRRGRPCKKDQKGMRMIVASCETLFKFQMCQYEHKKKTSKQARLKHSNSSNSSATTCTTITRVSSNDTKTDITITTTPVPSVDQLPQTLIPSPSSPQQQKTFRTSITIRELFN